MAYDAGVDIISMSISYNYLRYGYGGVEAVVARQLIEKGVYCKLTFFLSKRKGIVY